jgi:hypothetical protein
MRHIVAGVAAFTFFADSVAGSSAFSFVVSFFLLLLLTLLLLLLQFQIAFAYPPSYS